MLGTLKKLLQRMMRPFAKAARSLGLHPNLITIVGLIFAILSGYFLFLKQPIYATVLLLISGAFDLLDGFFARSSGLRSRFGGTLDAVSDRYGEFLVGIGAAFGGYVSWELSALTIFSMILPSYVRARAESTGGMRDCSVGVLERPEKILFIALASLFLALDPNSLSYGFMLVVILGHITALQRLFAVWQNDNRVHANKRY